MIDDWLDPQVCANTAPLNSHFLQEDLHTLVPDVLCEGRELQQFTAYIQGVSITASTLAAVSTAADRL